MTVSAVVDNYSLTQRQETPTDFDIALGWVQVVLINTYLTFNRGVTRSKADMSKYLSQTGYQAGQHYIQMFNILVHTILCLVNTSP